MDVQQVESAAHDADGRAEASTVRPLTVLLVEDSRSINT